MSINKIIDVWDENGYMMNTCVCYEDAYEKAEYYQKALDALRALDGDITLKSSAVANLSRTISELMALSRQAINDKSECMRRLKKEMKNE